MELNEVEGINVLKYTYFLSYSLDLPSGRLDIRSMVIALDFKIKDGGSLEHVERLIGGHTLINFILLSEG